MILGAFIHNIQFIRFSKMQDDFGSLMSSSSTHIPGANSTVSARVEKWTSSKKSMEYKIEGVMVSPSWVIYMPGDSSVVPEYFDHVVYKGETIGYVQEIVEAPMGLSDTIDHYEVFIVNAYETEYGN